MLARALRKLGYEVAITPINPASGAKSDLHQLEYLVAQSRKFNDPRETAGGVNDNRTVVDVALPDARKGYVVLGIGDVSVTPPFPTT